MYLVFIYDTWDLYIYIYICLDVYACVSGISSSDLFHFLLTPTIVPSCNLLHPKRKKLILWKIILCLGTISRPWILPVNYSYYTNGVQKLRTIQIIKQHWSATLKEDQVQIYLYIQQSMFKMEYTHIMLLFTSILMRLHNKLNNMWLFL